MEDYGQSVKGDFAAQGRLEDIPSSLEAPIRKVKEAATALVQLINADDEIIDPDENAERARVKGAVQEIATTAGGMTIGDIRDGVSKLRNRVIGRVFRWYRTNITKCTWISNYS